MESLRVGLGWGRENEPVPGAMAVGGGVGSCGGVGWSGGRFDDGRQTSSPLAARLPSPARPASPNTNDIVAGEGPGVGEHRVVVPARARERFRHRQRDPSSALRAPCIFQKGSKTASPPRSRLCWGGGRIGEGTSRLDRLWALAPVLACRVGFGQRSQTANCGCRSSTRDQAACRAGGRKVLPRAGQTRPASTRLTRWGDAAIAWGAPDWSCFGGPVTRWSGASLNP